MYVVVLKDMLYIPLRYKKRERSAAKSQKDFWNLHRADEGHQIENKKISPFFIAHIASRKASVFAYSAAVAWSSVKQ